MNTSACLTKENNTNTITHIKTKRKERDLLGEREVDAAVYYGVHTLRAVENFPITGTSISSCRGLVRALAQVKMAAARTNQTLGLLEPNRAKAIEAACAEIIDGHLHEQFVVDVIQGGAGTSTNMNANEVIANRGLELLGHARGEYQYLHPNEDVNMSQSTNDVYPTALRLALYDGVQDLQTKLVYLRSAFERKTHEFSSVLKMGRTQLQDAVPMTLGQEFNTYVTMLAEDERRLQEVSERLCTISLGATAIGTGITSDPRYAALACQNLDSISGVAVNTALDLVAATQDCSHFVELSGMLRRIAIKLSKICNDLRLLSSGPRAGLCEINLPPRQAGSSIMPGKVNPVIPEVVNQIAFEVMGNDLTIAFAAEAGQFQLNAFEPVIAHSLFKSLAHLGHGCVVLADLCVDGISANHEQLEVSVRDSIGIVTALNPIIGYAHSTDVAAEAHRSGRGVAELVCERGLMSEEQLNEALRPERLTQPQPIAAKY